jgi:hypothetical protein
MTLWLQQKKQNITLRGKCDESEQKLNYLQV